MRGEGQQNEGPCIGKEDLREVQGHQPPRGGSRDLRKRKAQAAPGLGGLARERKPPRGEALGIRQQALENRFAVSQSKLIPNA